MRKSAHLKTYFLSLIFIHLAACVSYEPSLLVPAVTFSAEDVSLIEDGNPNLRTDFGLELGLNESDSLLNVEVLPGVRVRSVAANGPADSAGVQIGDIILSINGMDTNHPDTVEVIQQQATSSDYEFQVQRNTTVFGTTVVGRSISETSGPEELYRIDPIATRAGFQTELLSINNDDEVAAARVVEIFPKSPFPAAGIAVNDVILAINGIQLNSAQDMVTRVIRDYELGEAVFMTVYNGASVAEREVVLWNPGRRLSRINLGPLLQYQSALNPSSESFSLLDFWLFAVYSYARTEGERSHSIFGLFNISSDYGELTELEN